MIIISLLEVNLSQDQEFDSPNGKTKRFGKVVLFQSFFKLFFEK
jgi:hypothetical protein